jgi:HPt (histidine-containing phosphotransfer) domain-containing protein
MNSQEKSESPFIAQVEEDLEDLAVRYLEKRKVELNRIRRMIEEENFQEIELIGHRIKGNAALFGLDVLGEWGASLEEAANRKESGKILNVSTEMQTFLKRVRLQNQKGEFLSMSAGNFAS